MLALYCCVDPVLLCWPCSSDLYGAWQVYDWIICVLLARNSAVPAADLSALSASATDAETVESDLLAHSLLRVRLEFSDVLMQQVRLRMSMLVFLKLLLPFVTRLEFLHALQSSVAHVMPFHAILFEVLRCVA